ncbi:hypothetical protein GH714_020575 [Hevea brasiliensis]|uniref:Uncharacterized protein n=1 Tax=Hevea brasiliensis TaxID=3981 RepID=A0A6A6KSH1_HEVBR|nr:hypothetical protein GH714_020575 [Hevea brasiliensis]
MKPPPAAAGATAFIGEIKPSLLDGKSFISLFPYGDGLQELLRASLDNSTSEEIEYKIPKPKRSLEEVQNFNFDVPNSQHPDAVVDADQIFSKDLIKPVFISQSKIEIYNSLDLASKMHSSFSSSAVVPSVDIQCHIFKKWRKSPQRILQKCFGFLRPLCL